MLDLLRSASRKVIATHKVIADAGYAQAKAPNAHNDALAIVYNCLCKLEDAARYLSARRAHPCLQLDSEDAVQDAIFLLLKPGIPDLEWENPSPKEGGSSWRPDFTSKQQSIAIDAKYIRDSNHGKTFVSKELDPDIAYARDSALWKDLFFLIYDPHMHIPDIASLLEHCNGNHIHNGKTVRVHTVIVPSTHKSCTSTS